MPMVVSDGTIPTKPVVVLESQATCLKISVSARNISAKVIGHNRNEKMTDQDINTMMMLSIENYCTRATITNRHPDAEELKNKVQSAADAYEETKNHKQCRIMSNISGMTINSHNNDQLSVNKKQVATIEHRSVKTATNCGRYSPNKNENRMLPYDMIIADSTRIPPKKVIVYIPDLVGMIQTPSTKNKKDKAGHLRNMITPSRPDAEISTKHEADATPSQRHLHKTILT